MSASSKASAMADSTQPEMTCPVLRAWQKSPLVMNRLLQGRLVFMPAESKKFKREHLGENVDLLAPLIDAVGSLVIKLAMLALDVKQ